MTDIQNSRYGRYFQALFGLKSQLTLGQTLPDVQPSLDIEAPRPEMELYLGNTLGAGYISAASIALFIPAAHIIVPSGSGVVCVVEKIWVQGVPGQFVAIARESFTGGAVGNTFNRDTRLGNRKPTTRLDGSNVAVGFYTVPEWVSQIGLDSTMVIDRPFVIADNLQPVGGAASALAIYGGTAAATLNVSIQFRERKAEHQELALL